MMKNGILTFLFAFIPGAGQMYQGYMKRGVSLVVLFCLGTVVGGTVLGGLGVGIGAVVYMYSFFDTFNLRAQLSLNNAPPDDYLLHIFSQGQGGERILAQRHKWLGWGLILLGALALYRGLLMEALWTVAQRSEVLRMVYNALDRLPELCLYLALIGVGVWLVRGPRATRRPEPPEPDGEADFREYRAAAQESPEQGFAWDAAPQHDMPQDSVSQAAAPRDGRTENFRNRTAAQEPTAQGFVWGAPQDGASQDTAAHNESPRRQTPPDGAADTETAQKQGTEGAQNADGEE